MEIKCDGNSTTSGSTKKNGQDNCQTTKANLDKHITDEDDDDDGVLSDAQLEWEHEHGIERSPKTYRKSEQDLLDILLTQSPNSMTSSTYIRASYCPDFEWDHLFDFAL